MSRKDKFLPLYVIVLLLLSLDSRSALAQDSTKYIDITEAIKATVNHNAAAQLAGIDEQIAVSNYKGTEAVYLPRVGFSYTALSTNDPLNAFGMKLQQKSISQNDFNPNLLNHPDGTGDFATSLQLQQPIINMDLWYQRKAAGKQIELYHYKTLRTREYLTFLAQKAYMQLQLAYTAVKVLEEALQTTQSVYTFTDNHYRQGLIQKSDVLNAQVRLASVESELAKAKSNIRNASDYLGLLMGRTPAMIYQVSELPLPSPQIDTSAKIAPGRSDFLAMEKAIEATDLMIKSSKLSYLPKINAFGTYQFHDKNMFGFGANAYIAGIQLTWNIFSGNSVKNAINTQILEKDRLSEQLSDQKDQSRLELRKAYRDLADAQNDIHQQKIAVDQAGEALTILQNRYQQGLVNTTDVLMATTQLSEQKFHLAQAVFTSGITRAYIELLTSSTNN